MSDNIIVKHVTKNNQIKCLTKILLSYGIGAVMKRYLTL